MPSATGSCPRRMLHSSERGDVTMATNKQEEAAEVIVCAGPPACMLQGDEAMQNQIDGCPRCRRIVVHEDGSETEYQAKAN